MRTQLLCTFTTKQKLNEVVDIVVTCNDVLYEKQSNTLYTINALNEVIREKNDGVLDKSYMVDWLEFENTLLLTNEMGLQKIPTKIFQIIDTSVWGKK